MVRMFPTVLAEYKHFLEMYRDEPNISRRGVKHVQSQESNQDRSRAGKY